MYIYVIFCLFDPFDKQSLIVLVQIDSGDVHRVHEVWMVQDEITPRCLCDGHLTDYLPIIVRIHFLE